MNRTAKIQIGLGGTLVAVAVFAAGCNLGDKLSEPYKDAPRSGVNSDPAEVIEMPDGFGNLAAKCDHGNMVYTGYHGDHTYGFVAAVHDPNCPQP